MGNFLSHSNRHFLTDLKSYSSLFIAILTVITGVAGVIDLSVSFAAIPGEIGPLEFGSPLPLKIQNFPQAFRFESYGEMKIQIRVEGKGNALPEIQVEGPLPQNGDQILLGAGLVRIQDANASHIPILEKEVKLSEPGVYRLILKSHPIVSGSNTLGDKLEISSSCLEGCHRPSILMSDFIAKVRTDGNVDLILSTVEKLLKDHSFSNSYIQEFNSQVAKADGKFLDHFPVVPLYEFDGIQKLLLSLRGTQTKDVSDTIYHGENLTDLLGSCEVERVGAQKLSWLPDNLKYGHFASLAYTQCQSAHSPIFSQILTSLSVGNGSFIKYNEQTYYTSHDLIQALLETHHEIQLKQERTIANFLSMTIDDKMDLIWPVWNDTVFKAAGNIPVVIPSGHSQHYWVIRGPVVDTQFSFFLGMYGAGFQAQTDTRPAWTGRRAIYNISTLDGENSRNIILKTFEAATAYLKLNRAERDTVALGLPSDGYAFLGICNDSDEFLARWSRPTFSSGFPFLRSPSLNQRFPAGDPIGDILKQIPDDTVYRPENRADVLKRVYDMRPYELDSDLWFDTNLKSQFQAIQAEFGL